MKGELVRVIVDHKLLYLLGSKKVTGSRLTFVKCVYIPDNYKLQIHEIT